VRAVPSYHTLSVRVRSLCHQPDDRYTLELRHEILQSDNALDLNGMSQHTSPVQWRNGGSRLMCSPSSSFWPGVSSLLSSTTLRIASLRLAVVIPETLWSACVHKQR
jgi:hypothetical protein